MADVDKRDDDRIPILGDLPGEIMVSEPMLIRDISHGGATIETGFPLQLNSVHELRLNLATTPLIVKGRVVHSKISDVDQDIVTYRSGLEFVEASIRVLDAIRDFLTTTKADRSGV